MAYGVVRLLRAVRTCLSCDALSSTTRNARTVSHDAAQAKRERAVGRWHACAHAPDVHVNRRPVCSWTYGVRHYSARKSVVRYRRCWPYLLRGQCVPQRLVGVVEGQDEAVALRGGLVPVVRHQVAPDGHVVHLARAGGVGDLSALKQWWVTAPTTACPKKRAHQGATR